MVRQSGFPAAVSGFPVWNILFAREPEQDMDLDEMDDQDKTTDTESSPDDPEQPSGKRPLLVGLLIVVAATGGYLAMHPDLLMDMMGQGTETVQAPTPPPAAPTKQATVPRTPATAPAPGAPLMPDPATAPATAPAPGAPLMPDPATAPATPATPRTENPVSSTPAAPPPSSVQTGRPGPAPAPSAPAVSTPSPLFSEGQQVAVVPNPALPAAAVSLSGNAARTKSGPMVGPTTVLTVVDGELHGNAWVYAVRTPQGTTGWAVEKQLRAAKR